MFVLKGCPRCGGDLNTGLDDDVTCIQCGHELTRPAAEAVARVRTAATRVGSGRSALTARQSRHHRSGAATGVSAA
jgi:uncharacterized membrane protein YvbJ